MMIYIYYILYIYIYVYCAFVGLDNKICPASSLHFYFKLLNYFRVFSEVNNILNSSAFYFVNIKPQ
jgi:hypothetical protein